MSMDEPQNNSISPPKPSKTNKHSKNPRRFSDDQIRSLESIFKLDTKLEPRKKLQIAKELGLQPRQVAIWFQNKRARWKSRQMEQEYKVLRTKYDNLHIQFDESKMENHSLKMQLEELRGLIKTLDKDRNFELKEYKGRSNEDMDHKFNHFASSVVVTKKMEEVEEEELLRWGEVEEISQLGSPEIWCNLSSRGLFDHSSSSISSSNWWEG